MFLFTTPLFINGLPVDYNVHKQESQYLFEPVFNPHEDLLAPQFKVKHEDQLCIFDTGLQEDIRAQVEEIIKEHLIQN